MAALCVYHTYHSMVVLNLGVQCNVGMLAAGDMQSVSAVLPVTSKCIFICMQIIHLHAHASVAQQIRHKDLQYLTGVAVMPGTQS